MPETYMADDPWGTAEPAPPENRTYREILEDPFANQATRVETMADSALGHTVMLLMRRSERAAAELVLEVETFKVEHDSYHDEWLLWLEVAPEQISRFTDVLVDKLRETCRELCLRLDYYDFTLDVRETLPDVGPHWREQLRGQMTSTLRPTNQGRRVRMGPPRFKEDHLAFTNEGERAVYLALRQIQDMDLPKEATIGIYPLAGGRLPGRTWEPDFLVTYRGKSGVLEVDGPHHNGRRAMDTTRDHLFHDAGIAFVDRIPVEVVSDPDELNAVLRRFLRRLGEKS
jgi:hypothetical protein